MNSVLHSTYTFTNDNQLHVWILCISAVNRGRGVKIESHLCAWLLLENPITHVMI